MSDVPSRFSYIFKGSRISLFKTELRFSFWQQWAIYIFKLIFLCTVFCCCCCCCFCLFFQVFLQKKNYLYIYFVIGTENLNIKVKVVIWKILVQYTFLILVFCTLVFFVRLIFLSLFFIFIFFSWQRWATMCL